MQDTIFRVKADLGDDAIILNTRRYKTGGFLGFFTREQVEVLAGLEERARKEQEEKKEVSGEKTLQEISDLKKMIREMEERQQKGAFLRDLSSTELASLYSHLKSQGVDSRFIRDFINDLKDSEDNGWDGLLAEASTNLISFLGKCVPVEARDQCQVMALVGPTGVGKTTTIAKLAARFALDKGKKVTLITADTYRIAAVQQLETYSEIMNIPIHVAYSTKELQEIIEEQRENYDLVLLDTAGSSCNDKIQMGRLNTLIERQVVDEVHLVISLNTKGSDMENIIDKFSWLNPDKLILTKLDETLTFGEIINLKYQYDLPYSYVTFGQNVPDDIQDARPEKLADYILGDLYD